MTYSNMTFGKKLLTISTLVISIWLVIGILIYRSTSFNSFHDKQSHVHSFSDSQDDEIEACLRNNQKLSSVFWRKVNLYQKEIPDSVSILASEVNVESNSTTYQESKVHFLFAKPKLKKNLSVLLLHGQSFTSDTWNKLLTLQNIAAFGYESIAIDIPGYGFSPVVQNLNKSELLNSLIASLNLKNIVIISPSMSGAFSLEFLIRHSDKLAGFIPVSPVGTQVLVKSPCAAQANNTIEYFDRDCQKVLPYLNSRIPTLNCIKVPTLVVFGEKDRSKSSARLCHLPNSHGAEIPHGEHAAYLSNPKLFHRLLFNFLDVLSKTVGCT